MDDTSVTIGAAQSPRLGFAFRGMERRRGRSRVITLDRPPPQRPRPEHARAKLSRAMPRFARDHDTYADRPAIEPPGTFCAGGDMRELARLTAIRPRRRPRGAGGRVSADLADGMPVEAGGVADRRRRDGRRGRHHAGQHPPGRGRRTTGSRCRRCASACSRTTASPMPLARLPGAIGAYLALTGRRLGRADAFALGLVTHCIDARHFDEIERGLADADTVDPLLDGLHEAAGPGELRPGGAAIDDCFSAAAVEEIRARLAARAAGGTDAEPPGRRRSLADLGPGLAAGAQGDAASRARIARARPAADPDDRLPPRRRWSRRTTSREGVRDDLIDRDSAPALASAHAGRHCPTR